MNRYTGFLAGAVVLLAVTVPRVLAQDTIGGYQWGASPQSIAQQTGAVPGNSEFGSLIRSETVLGRPAYLTYRFDSDGLSRVGIQWNGDMFAKARALLNSRYSVEGCSPDSTCRWSSHSSSIQLIRNSSLDVTLLVFSKRSNP